MDSATMRKGRTASLIAMALVFAICLGLSSWFSGNTANVAATLKPVPIDSSSSSPTPVAENCLPEFTQEGTVEQMSAKVDPGFEEAILASIDNDDDPLRGTILKRAGINGHRLAITAHFFGQYEDPNNWQSLVDNGCLSSEGQRLYERVNGIMNAEGVSFAIGEAPANGTNSGMDPNGTYGISATPGIYGDRRAIEITMPDGSKGWIMFRCGNPVFMGTPNLPHVPTDNPPPPTTTTPPGENPPPPTLTPKDPSKDPYVQGNAPTGGGKNADSGPGTYVPPTQMQQPPATPYVPPAPPAPRPPAQGGSGGQVPRPDPAPAPAPQPSAPAPTDPVDECFVIPGVEDCS